MSSNHFLIYHGTDPLAKPGFNPLEEEDVERLRVLANKIMLYLTTKEIRGFLDTVAEYNELASKVALEEEIERRRLVYRKV